MIGQQTNQTNNLFNKKIVLEAVKQDGFASKELQINIEIILEAVKQEGIPDSFNQSKEAVRQNGNALEFAFKMTKILCFYQLKTFSKLKNWI
jgi:hypothetical protein